MKSIIWFAAATLLLATTVAAADFGSPGGSEPANLDEVSTLLRNDPYDLELLISFGTSKDGSAGHLALAIRDQALGDDLVYSANFYADRTRKHASGFYTEELMISIPKQEPAADYEFDQRIAWQGTRRTDVLAGNDSCRRAFCGVIRNFGHEIHD